MRETYKERRKIGESKRETCKEKERKRIEKSERERHAKKGKRSKRRGERHAKVIWMDKRTKLAQELTEETRMLLLLVNKQTNVCSWIVRVARRTRLRNLLKEKQTNVLAKEKEQR